MNEETSNRRPIMLTYPSSTEVKQSNEKKEDNTAASTATSSVTSVSPETMDTDTETATQSTASDKKETVMVNGLKSQHISNIIT